MGRHVDPTSTRQVELRAKSLRAEDCDWTDKLCLTVAWGALKAYQWQHYLENGGDAGPAAGTFPKLPEEPGSWVMVGAQSIRSNPVDAAPANLVGFYVPEGPRDSGGQRLHTLKGREWVMDGQAEGCEVPDTEQLEVAERLAELIRHRHLRIHLTPSFYRRVATWMGELIAGPRPDGDPNVENGGVTLIADPKTWDMRSQVMPMGGVSVFLGCPHDLWRVPPEPLGLPSEASLAQWGVDAEDAARSGACWFFARELYRKVLDSRPDKLGRRGLERLHLLRQLLEELEVISPSGLKIRGIDGKPVASMATAEVPVVSLRALTRPDRWTTKRDEEGEEMYGRYLHENERKDGTSRWEVSIQEGESQASSNLAFASQTRCKEILDRHGLDLAALHGLLCCYIMHQEDPSARFEVNGEDLLRDLGLDNIRNGRSGQTRSDLLKRVASLAVLLGGVRCQGNSYKYSTGARARMELAPVWFMAVRADGQLKLLDNDEEYLGAITDLRLTVTPGPWVESGRVTIRDSGEERLLYVPMATKILSLGRFREEMAFRLGMYWGINYRINPESWRNGRQHNYRVGALLAQVLPAPQLERAQEDRVEAHRLIERWKAALVTLELVVGFRFVFHPDQYPTGLIPTDLRRPEHGEPKPTPRGALKVLMASRIEVHWPEPVVEARHRTLVATETRRKELTAQRTQRRELATRSYGQQLKEALDYAVKTRAVTSRADAAKRFGISKSQLSKYENGHKELPERELDRLINLLATLDRRVRHR